VWPALSLVTYEPAVAKALAYVLGSTFVCADPAAAKAVTYDPRIAARSVTLAGDVYEPGGTLSGGAAPAGAGLLVRMQELNGAEAALRAADAALGDLERAAEKERPRAEAWRGAERAREMKAHELALLEAQVAGSTAEAAAGDVARLQGVVAEHGAAAEAARARQRAADAEAARLEKDMAEFKNDKEGKIDELKVRLLVRARGDAGLTAGRGASARRRPRCRSRAPC
jgi:structural maintenance of chromosome 2